MVIKTDSCYFTEHRIYPGHGMRLVRKDGKLLAFINQKSRSLYLQKKKAQKLHWTQAWRRLHKKGSVEQEAKKRAKRTTKVFKAIAGLTIDEIKKKRQQKPDIRKAQREAHVREIKEKNRKQKEERKRLGQSAGSFKGKKAQPKATGFTKVPKSRKLLAGALRTH